MDDTRSARYERNSSPEILMMRERSIAVFPTGSTTSEELVQALLAALRASGVVRGWLVHVYGYPAETRFFQEKCHESDIVILDATIEPDGAHNYGVAPRMYYDHVLTVSRTYLPFNYGGIRSGGSPAYPGSLSNAQIVEWLIGQIRQLATIPREVDEYSVLTFVQGQQDGFRLYLDRMLAQAHTFVSYRTAQHHLVQELSAGADPGPLFWFRPGELVFEDELLTSYGRWQVFFLIEPWVTAARHFLIVNSPDYLASWWTQAELVILAYNRYTGRNVAEITILDPATGRRTPLSSDALPPFASEDFQRFNRFQKTADTHEAIPEEMQWAEWLGRLPLLKRFSLFREPFWKENFWSDAIIPCGACARAAVPGQAKTGPALVEAIRAISPSEIFDLTTAGLWRVPLETVHEQVQRGGGLRCPRCGGTVHIREEPNPRFLWLPSGSGNMPGPAGAFLQSFAVYRAG